MTAEQLQAARAAHWRQKQSPLLTLEDAERWLEQHPLCLYLPRRAQLPAPAPSFVEACMGSTQATPSAAAIEQAQGLLTRLVASGNVVALNLLGAVSEQPDFLAHSQALPYVLCLRADADWKHAPQKSSGHKVSPLVLELWKALDKDGVLSAAQARETLGRELTEAAVLRGLCELWQALRVSPVFADAGQPAQWELLRVRHRDALATAAATSQVTALIAAGIHVSAVGLRRLERGDRDFSFPGGVAFAGAGSGARLGRHAADPFAFDGCPDVLLPGRWLAGVRRAGGSRDGEYGAPGTGCGGHSEGGDSAAAVGRSRTDRPARPDAPRCAVGPPSEANSVCSPAWRASKIWGRAFRGANGVDGSTPACGQASRDRGPGQKRMRVSGAQVRRDAASRQEPLGKQAGGNPPHRSEARHAWQGRPDSGQTNGRLGGLDQKNGNGRFRARPGPRRGRKSVLDPVLNPVKDQHPHPVLRVPGTAAVRLSGKDKSLAQALDGSGPRGVSGGDRLRGAAPGQPSSGRGKDFRRVPAVIVPGQPSGLLLRGAPRVDLPLPFATKR